MNMERPFKGVFLLPSFILSILILSENSEILKRYSAGEKWPLVGSARRLSLCRRKIPVES